MKGSPQEVPVPQKEEAEVPPRRPPEWIEIELSEVTGERVVSIVERLEPGDHVFFMKDGRRIAELNWTMHIDPPTAEELAAAKKRLRNSKGNPKAKLILTRADLYG